MPTNNVAPDAPTPIWISRRTLRALVAVGVAALALLLWRAPTIVSLAVGGAALALVLSLPVRVLSRAMPRGAAIALTMVLAAALVVVAITVIVPIAVEQLRALVAAVPRTVERLGERVPSAIDVLTKRGLLPGSPEGVREELRQRLLATVQGFVGRLLGGVGPFVSGAAGVALALLGTVLVAVTLLADARRIRAAVLRASPHRYRRDVRALWDTLGQTLSRYLGGLALSMTAEGVLAAIAFHVLGVPYAFVLGAWVGLTAVIPYVGAWLGYAPALLLALSVSPMRALVTLLVCLLINVLVGNVLSPRIQGRAVRVNPSVVFLAVAAGGELFGVPGVVLAVPAVAMLRVLLDFFRARLRVAEEGPSGVRPAREARDDGRPAAVVVPQGAGVSPVAPTRVPADA